MTALTKAMGAISAMAARKPSVIADWAAASTLAREPAPTESIAWLRPESVPVSAVSRSSSSAAGSPSAAISARNDPDATER